MGEGSIIVKNTMLRENPEREAAMEAWIRARDEEEGRRRGVVPQATQVAKPKRTIEEIRVGLDSEIEQVRRKEEAKEALSDIFPLWEELRAWVDEKAAKKLKAKASNCIVFEDTLHGIEAAKRAKMKVAGVATSHHPKEISHADLIIKDFSKINIKKLLSLQK